MQQGLKRKYTFWRWLVDSVSWCAFVFFVFLVLRGQVYGWVGIVVCALWYLLRFLRQTFYALPEDVQKAFSDWFALFASFVSGKMSGPTFLIDLQMAQARIEHSLEAIDPEAYISINLLSVNQWLLVTIVVSVIVAVIAFFAF